MSAAACLLLCRLLLLLGLLQSLEIQECTPGSSHLCFWSPSTCYDAAARCYADVWTGKCTVRRVLFFHTHRQRKQRLLSCLFVYQCGCLILKWHSAPKGKAAGVRRRTLHRAALVLCFYVCAAAVLRAACASFVGGILVMALYQCHNVSTAIGVSSCTRCRTGVVRA
jgi:hypothetical protein